jgi:hypothetical protein
LNLAALHLIEHLDDNNVGWQQAWDEYEDACSTERQHPTGLVGGNPVVGAT